MEYTVLNVNIIEPEDEDANAFGASVEDRLNEDNGPERLSAVVQLDELDGTEDFVSCAIQFAATNPQWAVVYVYAPVGDNRVVEFDNESHKSVTYNVEK